MKKIFCCFCFASKENEFLAAADKFDVDDVFGVFIVDIVVVVIVVVVIVIVFIVVVGYCYELED